MRKPICMTALATACTLLAVSACNKSEEARPDDETAAMAESAQATPSPVAGDASLTTRQREWQALLDTVRATVDHDTAATALALRSAAASVRREAAEANQNAKAALTRSADELDSLAASFSRGTKRTAASLDSAFARLEYSETLSRLANATDAWATQQRMRASEELQAAANSYARAAEATRMQLDSAATKARDDARDVAERLRRNAEVTDAEFRESVAELEKQARRVGERITRRS